MKLTNIKCKNVHFIIITQNFSSMLSEEAETDFVKWLWFRHYKQGAATKVASDRTGMCTEHISLLSMFPQCFARKGMMQGSTWWRVSCLSSSSEFRQQLAPVQIILSLYKLITPPPSNEDKFSPTSLICPCCTSFAHHSQRCGTHLALQSFSCFHLFIMKSEEEILCNLSQRAHGHTSRTNKNLMWLFVTYCCILPDTTWELTWSQRSRKTKSSGAILLYYPFSWANLNGLWSVCSSIALFHHPDLMQPVPKASVYYRQSYKKGRSGKSTWTGPVEQSGRYTSLTFSFWDFDQMESATPLRKRKQGLSFQATFSMALV